MITMITQYTTSTFVSATSLLGTDSSTSTPPAYNCPMNIQQTEPWVHVVYCVIIVIIILISVIVFLLSSHDNVVWLLLEIITLVC